MISQLHEQILHNTNSEQYAMVELELLTNECHAQGVL